MSRSIVLLFPRCEPDYPDEAKLIGLPLAVLTVARPLVRAGYDVRIIDENVRARAIDELVRLDRPLFVGISCLGGGQIPTGLALARLVSKLWPGVPRVWGGWNPTLLPHLYEDDARRGEVDVVVRGRGEAPVLEIARKLEAGEEFDGIPGVSWWDREGRLRRNPDAPLDDPTESDLLPYDLIDSLDDYITRHGVINYHSSYGCPHRCNFCGIPAGTRTFRVIRNERVVDQLHQIKARGIHTVIFYDDNFFTRKDRVVDLAQRMIDTRLGMSWYSNGRIDQLMTLSEDEYRVLARSGCRGINVGYETGDQRVADEIQKDVVVGDIVEIARRFKGAGIHLSVNFMVGLPGEDVESLLRSLHTLFSIHAANQDMELCWYMFMPAPGTLLWERMIREGRLTEPRTLEEHARLQSMYLEHPWYYESPRESVFREWREKHKAIAWYFQVGYAASVPAGRWRALWFGLLRRWCRRRFEHRWFRLRLDWRAFFVWNAIRVRLRWTTARALRARAFDRFARRRARGNDSSGSGTTPIPWVHRST